MDLNLLLTNTQGLLGYEYKRRNTVNFAFT